MSRIRVRSLLLGLIAAVVLATASASAFASSATVTINTNGGITATSSGKITIVDNGLGTITCNVTLGGSIASGTVSGSGTSPMLLGVITTGSSSGCNPGISLAFRFTKAWGVRTRADSITSSGGNITAWNLSLIDCELALGGAAVGGSATFHAASGLTLQLNNSTSTLYPLAMGALANMNRFNISSAIGGNIIASDIGTTAAVTASFAATPAINGGATVN